MPNSNAAAAVIPTVNANSLLVFIYAGGAVGLFLVFEDPAAVGRWGVPGFGEAFATAAVVGVGLSVGVEAFLASIKWGGELVTNWQARRT